MLWNKKGKKGKQAEADAEVANNESGNPSEAAAADESGAAADAGAAGEVDAAAESSTADAAATDEANAAADADESSAANADNVDAASNDGGDGEGNKASKASKASKENIENIVAEITKIGAAGEGGAGEEGEGEEGEEGEDEASNTTALREPIPGRASLDVVTSLYLNFLGEPVGVDDLWRGLPQSEDSVMTDALLERALGRIGYAPQFDRAESLEDVVYPCVLLLEGGTYAFASSQEGDTVCLVDGRQAGGIERELPIATLAPMYSGQYIQFFPTMGELERRHIEAEEERHWFWARLFRPRSRVVDVIMSSVFANLIAVTVSLFALQVYDRVIPNENKATLWVLALGAAVAILFEFFLRSARAKLIDDTGRTAEIDMTRVLFQKLLGVRLDKVPAGPGTLAYMVREFQGVREFFNTATVGVLADLPFVFFFLLLIYFIAGPVVFIVMVGAVMIVTPSLLFQGKMARLSRETQGGLSAASRLLTEAAYGLENAKSAHAEPWLLKTWEETVYLNAVKASEQRNLAAKLTFWAGSVQQWTYISAIIGGSYMLFAGEFTLGSIIAISILSGRTLAPISQLAGVLTRWQNMKVALDGMDKVIKSDQEREPDRTYIRKSRLNGNVSLKAAQATYPFHKLPTIHIAELNLEPGDRLALLGANGSGKSTLLRMLSGLHPPSSGDYLLDGVDIGQIDPADVRNSIGYVPQEARLFRGTLRENMQVPDRQTTDEDYFAALEFAGLREMVAAHPKGMDLPIQDGGVGLSTGQKTAVGLARLHLLDPAIVVLDEPTAALDQQLENQFVSRFDTWLGKRTCIIATHRTTILRVVNKVGIMQAGKLVILGPRDAVLAEINKRNKHLEAVAK